MPQGLDEFNGHNDSDGYYHYHATRTFPYINGGLRGIVAMDGDQIRQPRDSPVRPGQSPLQGATITGFSRTGNQFDLEYELASKTAHIKYSILDDDRVVFSFVDPSGNASSVIYRRSDHERGLSIGRYVLAFLLLLGFCAVAVVLWNNSRIPKSATQLNADRTAGSEV